MTRYNRVIKIAVDIMREQDAEGNATDLKALYTIAETVVTISGVKGTVTVNEAVADILHECFK